MRVLLYPVGSVCRSFFVETHRFELCKLICMLKIVNWVSIGKKLLQTQENRIFLVLERIYMQQTQSLEKSM